MTYKRIIKVPHGEIGKLAAFCKCSSTYASQCLQGMYQSEKADEVRRTAFKFFRAYEIKIPTYTTK